MVVLSALVRNAGLPSAAPLLVQHGLRSTAWRTREGALKLVIAGLLCWRPTSSSSSSRVGVAAGHSKTNERFGGERGRQKGGRAGDSGRGGSGNGGGGDDSSGHDELERGDNRSDRGSGGGGGGDHCGRGCSSSERLPVPANKVSRSGGEGQVGATAMAMDNEKLLRDVGSLLMDERPEVGVNPCLLVLFRTDAFEVFSKFRVIMSSDVLYS